MRLLGRNVQHPEYGNGVIVEVNGDEVEVSFDGIDVVYSREDAELTEMISKISQTSVLNKDSYKAIKRFFKDDDALSVFCAEVIKEAFGKCDDCFLSVGKAIKAGQIDADPDLIIDGDGSAYRINLCTTNQMMEFHLAHREIILEKVREYRRLFEKQEENSIVFVDCEIDPQKGRVLDLGATREDDSSFHENNSYKFKTFVSGSTIICGHNIVKHDLQYIRHFFDDDFLAADTLLLSALLFPQRAHHNLEKDDKFRFFEKNNPLFDAQKAKTLFYREVDEFNKLDEDLKAIYYLLLKDQEGFQGFFKYIGYSAEGDAVKTIERRFKNSICSNVNIGSLTEDSRVEMAYTLSVIAAEDETAIFAPWVLLSFPGVDSIMKKLRNTPCGNADCVYCSSVFDVRSKLKDYFGFDEFRTFEGKPLQEQSVADAAQGKSFITVFPTGGGKSLAFQLPALIAGDAEHALTVVISPLQALMRDQVDNLEKKWMINAVMINGLLDPVSRKEAIERVANGTANILYISPEALRNNTISTLIRKRIVARFVIDEAHCFSSWGQDFRVDYKYIGKFIRELQEEKELDYQIPVSCFTATAGQRVLGDIYGYFKSELGLDMDFLITSPERENLRYGTRTVEGAKKYTEIRDLITTHSCPTIVYVFRVADTYRIAAHLFEDGINALPFNGPMSSIQKEDALRMFLTNEVQVIVATSAFGMGVDKEDVGLVIHYQVSSSLEDYLQEAGRAGRDEKIEGDCITLFDESDIEFNLFNLNQSKLSLKEIQSVWTAVKKESRGQRSICISAKELALAAGWTDNDNRDTETEVKTALGALENAGYLERGNNVFRLYATGIIPKSMIETRAIIDRSNSMDPEEKRDAILIMETLFTSEWIGKVLNENSKRTDAIADILAMEHRRVLHIVDLLKEENILADSQDIKAIVYTENTERKSSNKLNSALRLEDFLIREVLRWEDETIDYKEINEKATAFGVGHVTPVQIKGILMHWAVRKHIRLRKMYSTNVLEIEYIESRKQVEEEVKKRRELSDFIIKRIYGSLGPQKATETRYIEFSLLELKKAYEEQIIIHEGELKTTIEELQDALMFIQRIGALKMEGGFFVLHQRMKIKRLEMNNAIKYKKDDYKELQNYYVQKIRQIHIMAEYIRVLKTDPQMAKRFVNDYFAMDPDVFDRQYFSKEQIQAMKKAISPKQYRRMFEHLSETQRSIINDGESQYITVAAGPGSGKTMVLVHKLASLILLEDVKCEQLLMLTFSRLAATEFKRRLLDLIGPPANYVEIKTFHSYCFDILGRKGNAEEFHNIEKEAVDMMTNGEIEGERINKAVLVVDEAQDISNDEFNFINTMISLNEDMRVILVGDDDQNIFEFRGSSSEYMKQFIDRYDASVYNMPDNYRSDRSVVAFANELSKSLSGRIKSEPVHAVSKVSGSVVLAKYSSQNLEIPVLEMINQKKTYSDTCILTRTNEEAYWITGALLEAGVHARLIQNMDGFKLKDLAEIRRFLDIIHEGTQTPVIPDDLWLFARDTIISEFKGSSVLETCCAIIDEFDAVNKDKYKSDLEDYLTESHFEDYIKEDDNEIVVSTIHKAKGREYANVYLVLNNASMRTDEERRLMYVGCTRAKNNLVILYNNNIMDPLKPYATECSWNQKLYRKPKRSILRLSHKGVFLDYFIEKQSIIKKLKSGDKLTVHGKELLARINDKEFVVGRLSSAGHAEVRRFASRGNIRIHAEVQFVVHWKKKGTDEEYMIILPTIFIENK